MPWHIEQGGGTCGASEWAVIKDSDGSTEGCHPTKAEAEDQMAALYANESASASAKEAAGRRAEHFRSQPKGVPRGSERVRPFATEFRAKLIERDGKELHQLDGYASVVDKPYEMWDFLGPYTEVVAAGAFDDTVAADPDVAFLVNHRGMTMARTTAGTLELEADALGLRSRAFLNPKRYDVADLITAIDDRNITEMSFAFLIEDGEWSDDYTQYRIKKVDIDRGDVSAVNYGANPHTSIAARAAAQAWELVDRCGELPPEVARAAFQRLQRRFDLTRATPPAEKSGELAKVGRSVSLVLAQLALDED